jgi:hypothetical protein
VARRAARLSGLETAYARAERMVGRRVAGEYVLVPLVGRGADLDSIYSLNRVGAFVWERLDGRAKGSEIIAAIVERFAVDRAAARRDYGRFIAELRSIGAVERA